VFPPSRSVTRMGFKCTPDVHAPNGACTGQRRVRVRAIRRCGELLKTIPAKAHSTVGLRGGEAHPHHVTSERAQAAKDAGLSADQTKDALRIAKVPPAEFEQAVESPSPPTVEELGEAVGLRGHDVRAAAKRAAAKRRASGAACPQARCSVAKVATVVGGSFLKLLLAYLLHVLHGCLS
jgi:hypothetical protein